MVKPVNQNDSCLSWLFCCGPQAQHRPTVKTPLLREDTISPTRASDKDVKAKTPIKEPQTVASNRDLQTHTPDQDSVSSLRRESGGEGFGDFSFASCPSTPGDLSAGTQDALFIGDQIDVYQSPDKPETKPLPIEPPKTSEPLNTAQEVAPFGPKREQNLRFKDEV